MKGLRRTVRTRRNRSESQPAFWGWETEAEKGGRRPGILGITVWEPHSALDNGMTITSNFPHLMAALILRLKTIRLLFNPLTISLADGCMWKELSLQVLSWHF